MSPTRFDEDRLAKVRIVIADTAEAQRRLGVAEERWDPETGSDDLSECIEKLRDLLRFPMHVEVSVDDGQTWGALPTVGGVTYICDRGSGHYPRARVDIPLVPGFFDGTSVPYDLPEVPEAVEASQRWEVRPSMREDGLHGVDGFAAWRGDERDDGSFTTSEVHAQDLADRLNEEDGL